MGDKLVCESRNMCCLLLSLCLLPRVWVGGGGLVTELAYLPHLTAFIMEGFRAEAHLSGKGVCTACCSECVCEGVHACCWCLSYEIFELCVWLCVHLVMCICSDELCISSKLYIVAGLLYLCVSGTLWVYL